MKEKICVAEVSPDWRFTKHQRDLVLKYAASCFMANESDFIWHRIVNDDYPWEDGEPYTEYYLYLPKDKIGKSLINNETAFNNAIIHLSGFVWGISYL